MLAASLMEWYLQTRTNTSINYKTILLLEAVFLRFHALFPTLIHPALPPSRQSIAQPASSSPLSTRRPTFDHPHSPCNLENDRAEPRASQIFDTRRLERKERDAVFRIRPSGMTSSSRRWKRKSGDKKTMNTVVNRWGMREERIDRVGGGRSGSLETNFSEIDWKTNTGAKRSWLRSDDPLNY